MEIRVNPEEDGLVVVSADADIGIGSPCLVFGIGKDYDEAVADLHRKIEAQTQNVESIEKIVASMSEDERARYHEEMKTMPEEIAKDLDRLMRERGGKLW